jgi:hypothetical protein
MKTRRCLVVRGPADLAALSESDRAEVERLSDLLRRSGAAMVAGVPPVEAVCAIYPDVYPDGEPPADPDGDA